MSDTKQNETALLTSLKNKADMLGVTYHPSIGLDKLKEKVAAKMNELPEKDEMSSGQVGRIEPKTKMEKHQEASKLVRIILNSRDPNKKDWPGEIVSVGNSTVGFFKKYIPYGVEWHVPQIILNTLKEKQLQVFVNKVDDRGNKTKQGKLIKAYTIQDLPPLSAEEIKALATAQAASGRLEE